MSVPTGGSPRRRHAAASRWTTICYALESTARTVRLCAIMLAASIPPGMLALLIRH